MQDKSKRLPVPAAHLPDFVPVPRKVPRHDGWTPERQRAFVEALADTGCVRIAARMVNMTPESAYMLRRAPGAEAFRKAWEAAQGLGLQVVKDEAFDRALNGQLVPVFVGGKLMGFRRKKNDRLLMFILRHYGFAEGGGRTTVNYISTRATAGAAQISSPAFAGEGDHPEGGGGAISTPVNISAPALAKADPSAIALAKAEASTTTVKTVISGKGADPRPSDDESAHRLETFAGVDLDDQAKADIYRALEAAAERRRALDDNPAEDPDIAYVGEHDAGPYAGELELGVEEDWVAFQPGACPEQGRGGEHGWRTLGKGGNAEEIDRAVAAIRAEQANAAPALSEVEGPVLSLSRAEQRGEVEGRLLEAPPTTLADLGVGETRRPDKERQRKPKPTEPKDAGMKRRRN